MNLLKLAGENSLGSKSFFRTKTEDVAIPEFLSQFVQFSPSNEPQTFGEKLSAIGNDLRRLEASLKSGNFELAYASQKAAELCGQEKKLLSELHSAPTTKDVFTLRAQQLQHLAKRRQICEKNLRYLEAERDSANCYTSSSNDQSKYREAYRQRYARIFNSDISHSERSMYLGLDYLSQMEPSIMNVSINFYVSDYTNGKANTSGQTAFPNSKDSRQNVFNFSEVSTFSRQLPQTSAFYFEVNSFPSPNHNSNLKIGWTLIPLLSLYEKGVPASGCFKLPLLKLPVRRNVVLEEICHVPRAGNALLFIRINTEAQFFQSDMSLFSRVKNPPKTDPYLPTLQNTIFSNEVPHVGTVHSNFLTEDRAQYRLPAIFKIPVQVDFAAREELNGHRQEVDRLRKLLVNQQNRLEKLMFIEGDAIDKLMKTEAKVVAQLKVNPFEFETPKMINKLEIEIVSLTAQMPKGGFLFKFGLYNGKDLALDVFGSPMEISTDVYKLLSPTDKEINIEFSQSFAADLEQMISELMAENKNLLLVIQVIGDEQKLLMWSFFYLGDEDENKVAKPKVGIFDEKLNAPRDDLPLFKDFKALKKSFIRFRIKVGVLSESELKNFNQIKKKPKVQESTPEPPKPVPEEPIKEMFPLPTVVDESKVKKIRPKKQNDKKKVNAENENKPYIRYEKKYRPVQFATRSIDIYFDQVKYLPDNVALIKPIVRIVDSMLEDRSDFESFLPNLESIVNCPVFNKKLTFNLTSTDETLYLLVKYMAIDEFCGKKEMKELGVSCFPILFVQEGSKILHSGNFEIPIYAQELRGSLHPESLEPMERIPGLTLLVRVRAADKGDEEMPSYAQGEYYNGMIPAPEILENELYSFRQSTPPTKISFKAKFVLKAFNVEVGDSPLEVQTALDELFYETTRITKNNIFSFAYFNKYQPQAGFSLKIEGIYQCKDPGLPICIVCPNPPGAFFKEVIQPDGCYLYCQPEWGSTLDHSKFRDSFLPITGVSYDRFSHLIISFLKLTFDSKNRPNLKTIGFSVLPLFSEENYINSGFFQLPLFKGTIDPETVQLMHLKGPLEVLLSAASAKKKGEKLETVENASLVVCLKDAFLGEVFTKNEGFERLNTSLLPENQKEDYLLNEKKLARMVNSKQLSKLILPGVTEQEMNYIIESVIEEAYSIKK